MTPRRAGLSAWSTVAAEPGAFTETDIEEFTRAYSRPDGWRGAIGLYRSMLREGAEGYRSPAEVYAEILNSGDALIP
ncbi:hypothetical protein AB0D67_07325 [Streptosporangium sp. NPDC048047]|uniref:hypothetical protein n=1 Tax=Streptosporangium sp. NPDC048047 TaxID=3155748 RepID=UPI003445A4C0